MRTSTPQFIPYRSQWDEEQRTIRRLSKRDRRDLLESQPHLGSWSAYYQQLDDDLREHHGGRRNWMEGLPVAEDTDDKVDSLRYEQEFNWLRCKRPYYNIWPGVVDHLIRLDLSKVPSEMVNLPSMIPLIPAGTLEGMTRGTARRCEEVSRTLNFRFPPGHPSLSYEDSDGTTRTMNSALVCVDRKPDGDMLIIFMDFGGLSPDGTRLVLFRCHPLKPGTNLGGVYDDVPTNSPVPRDVCDKILKLIVASTLISQGEDGLIEPDVLSADRWEYSRSKDPALVDKARERGKNGYNIGMDIEVSPHWRSPCLALYWTGKGRTTPRVRMRRGSIVHRKAVAAIPTGHDGE